MSSGISPAYLTGIFIKLMENVPITLLVVLISGVLAFFLGAAVSAVRIQKIKILYPLFSIYISFARSTPILIQLFVIYYGSPLLFSLAGIDINQWGQTVFAIITLIFHNAAILSEIARPAYLAVDKGQHDAADSIGLSGFHKVMRIIVPQMVPIALPSLGNLLIDLIKDTSILFTIGVVDLMGRAKQIIANNYGIGKVYVFIVVALIYWFLSAVAEKFIRIIEKRHKKYKFAAGVVVGKGELDHDV